jgi:hypothetical protein
LERGKKLTRSEKHYEAQQRDEQRRWRELWIACGRTAEEFDRVSSDELYQWRRAIGKGRIQAERLAWERDHPGLCGRSFSAG